METREHRIARIREGLSSLYLPYYDELFRILPPEWMPTEGLRSIDRQNLLWSQGRSTPGKIVTNAKGGCSPHNYGCAVDATIWVNGVPSYPDPDKDYPLWQPYVEAVKAAGLRAGAYWGDYPHNELKIDCSWQHVYLMYNQGGMAAAQQKIEVAHASAIA